MPRNLPLELRPEFQTAHFRGTAIELRNRQGTGWTEKDPTELLEITYPTSDVQRALQAISTAADGRPLVFLGDRGRGKSHIMALLHHAFRHPDRVQAWAKEWGAKPDFERLSKLQLPIGFEPISEPLSNEEYRTLWDLIFERHPRGEYYRGRYASAGTTVPPKSLIQDLFTERPTALILDEFQSWFDGLHDESGETGLKRRQWAFNFIQILSELAKERPDLLMLVVSVRHATTDAYQQIHRVGPALVNFKGESARGDRKKLLLHRLFKNRAQFAPSLIEQTVSVYAHERVRLLHSSKPEAEKARLRTEVGESWPFAPELLSLLEDHILMADAAQDKRDMIRVLAELFRARGEAVPLLTPSDFLIDDDGCGVVTLIDSFATTSDQEKLRDKAIRNLQAFPPDPTSHAREVISGIWIRSLSATNVFGGTREELQLDLTRHVPIDDNAFTAELTAIVENSSNIHPLGANDKRYCFRQEENPTTKVKAHARNDKLFEPDGPTAPNLLPVMKDQAFIRQVLEHMLRSPDSVNEPPTRAIVLDPNWEAAPWANIQVADQPERWDKPVLIVLPVAPADVRTTLGPWLKRSVPVKRNMVRFLLPKSGLKSIYDDPTLRHLARCTVLAKGWKEAETPYEAIFKRFDRELRRELGDRFDRYAALHRWSFQQPEMCVFHVEGCSTSPDKVAKTVEDSVRHNLFAPEDFERFIVDAAGRGDTMRQVMSQMREPPPRPDIDAIPYLGDIATYEEVIKVAARDMIALNVDGSWQIAEPGEAQDSAYRRLRSKCIRTGRALEEVQLGLPEVVGSGGVTAVSVSTQPTPPESSSPVSPSRNPVTTPNPPLSTTVTSGGTRIGATESAPFLPVVAVQSDPAPVICQSNGSKSGINLLRDIERWGLPDADKINITTITLRGLTVKELRELCTRLPPKLLAELQITSNPEQGDGSSR